MYTPSGIERRLVRYDGIDDDAPEVDLATLYEQRCVDADPALQPQLEAARRRLAELVEVGRAR